MKERGEEKDGKPQPYVIISVQLQPTKDSRFRLAGLSTSGIFLFLVSVLCEGDSHCLNTWKSQQKFQVMHFPKAYQ